MIKVGIGHAGGGEEAGEGVFPKIAGIQASGTNGFQRRPCRGGDLRPRAIGQRDGQIEPCVRLGVAFGCRQIGLDIGIEPAAVADEAQAYAGLLQFGDLRPQITPQKAGQVHDLAGRAAPVLTAERIDGQPGDAGSGSPPQPCAGRRGSLPDGPAMRGRPRDFAQRPLPSMMMATWPGTMPGGPGAM